MIDRFCVLAKYVEAGGADAILFTCSAFGAAIEIARTAVRIPVLKPNEAMMEEAIATGPRIALLATFEPSLPSMKSELEQLAAARKASIHIRTKAVPQALAALQLGDDLAHDKQIAAAAEEFSECDALLLCQFSMASAAERIPACRGRSVFTSPYSAVARLKQLLHA
jgi:Asp/Glu/hydantoin racemase